MFLQYNCKGLPLNYLHGIPLDLLMFPDVVVVPAFVAFVIVIVH